MLRTIFVLLIATVGTVSALFGPFNGLLYYLWVAHFRPETWVWSDLVQDLNLSLIAGIVTLIGAIFGRVRFRFDGRSALVLAFGLQNLISTLFSPHFNDTWTPFVEFAKSLLIVYLIQCMVDDVGRLRRVFMVIALSLSFEGAKQGWAQLILNPGAQNINEITQLGDNNAVAVGMLMVVALLIALAALASGKWERRMYQFLTVGVLYRALLMYSRGGLLACIAMGLWYLFRSKQKAVALISLLLASALILPVLPSQFWQRMNTINQAREDIDSADESIQSRLHFWRVAVDIANANPILGVGNFGFNAAYDLYDATGGTFGTKRSVHSTWFGTAAELGYLGLFMLITIIVVAFGACFRARAAVARGAPQVLEKYALALEMGLIAFVVGGTFVVLQYNELIWHFVGLTMALSAIAVAVPKEVAARSIEPGAGFAAAGRATVAWRNA